MISSTAIFACSSIEATLAYYKDVLGFDSSWTWGDPPTFGSASMGEVSIMFNLQPEVAQHVRGHQHWFSIDDADELYRLHTSNGANVVSPIDDKPWNVREYVIEDLNGYHLRFSGPPSGSAPKSQPFPEQVRIERGTPEGEEFQKVAHAAFGNKQASPEVFASTWGSVVARSPDGDAIGVLRIMRDAPGWFSIWDVAVLPEWQAQRIGSAMVKEAVEMIREAEPGAIVYLFTFKHGFYERLGFKTEHVSMRRL